MRQKLGIVLTPADKSRVTAAVAKMFLLQGVARAEKDVVLFADEVCKCGYSVNQIVTGIESLKDFTLRKISFEVVLAAIRERGTALYDTREEEIPHEERMQSAQKIADLKAKWGKDWFKHFNDEEIKNARPGI